MTRPTKRIALLASMPLLVCAVLLMPAALAQPEPPQPPREPRPERQIPTILVTGRAELTAAPDKAVLQIGAQVQDRNAAAAHEHVNTIVNGALERFKAMNIPAERVSTAGITIHPVYAGQRPPRVGDPPEEPRIAGYRASNMLRVELHDMNQVGQVIDAAVAAGANQFHGVSFELRDDSELRRQALRQAAQEARAKAQALAEALDVQLGELREVSEAGADVVFPRMREDMAFRAMAAEAAPTPVMPGQVRVEARVTLAYRIGRAGE